MRAREQVKRVVGGLGLTPMLSRMVLHREHKVFTQRFRPRSRSRSILLYTTVKCASTSTHRIVSRVAAARDAAYAHINLFRYFYNQNIDGATCLRERGEKILLPEGCIYGPLRVGIRPENLQDVYTVVILRDPRDVLVSLYYSQGVSHPVPMHPGTRSRFMKERALANRESIDDFVLRRAPEFSDMYRDFMELADTPGVLFLTYEEFVTDFEQFFRKLCDYLEAAPERVDREYVYAIAGVDKVVSENETKHIRKRTPGDHTSKLKPETIQKLDHVFADYLGKIQYG